MASGRGELHFSFITLLCSFSEKFTWFYLHLLFGKISTQTAINQMESIIYISPGDSDKKQKKKKIDFHFTEIIWYVWDTYILTEFNRFWVLLSPLAYYWAPVHCDRKEERKRRWEGGKKEEMNQKKLNWVYSLLMVSLFLARKFSSPYDLIVITLIYSL